MKSMQAFIQAYAPTCNVEGLEEKERSMLARAKKYMLHASYTLYHTDDKIEDRIAIFQLLFYPRYREWARFEHEILHHIKARERASDKESCYAPITESLTTLWKLYYGRVPTGIQQQVSKMVSEHCACVAKGLAHTKAKQQGRNKPNDTLMLAIRQLQKQI